MHSTQQQIIFLRQVRARLGPDIHFAEELAETLHISTDSAYRRMRGQTAMTFQEVALLSRKYNLSIDALLGQQLDTVSFQFTPLKASLPGFHEYLRNLQDQLLSLQDIDNSELYCASSDLPLFHYFAYPALTAFKIYFWLRVYCKAPDVCEKHYERQLIPEELVNRARQAYQAYLPLHSKEIIHPSALDTSLQEIHWCLDRQLIRRKGEALELVRQVNLLFKNLKAQIQKGAKPDPDPYQQKGGKLALYVNQFSLGDSIILMKQGDRIISHLNQHMLHIMLTTHETFGANCLHYIRNLMDTEAILPGDAAIFTSLSEQTTALEKRIYTQTFAFD